MAIFVPRFVRQLRDVLLTAPADGEVLTYDSADAKWKNEAGGGGGDLTDAVILAPASSARNVIQPTAGAVIAAIVKAHAAQSVDLTQWQDSTGGVLMSVSETGTVLIEPNAVFQTALILKSFDPASAQQETFQIKDSAGNNAFEVQNCGEVIIRLLDPLQGGGIKIIDQVGISLDLMSLSSFAGGTYRVDKDAGLLISRIAAPADGGISTSEIALWFDSTNGAAKFMLKGKTVDATVVTWEIPNGVVYVAGGTDVALADGGTGASLVDPGADRIMFWDDSAGAVTWLTAGTNLTITGTTLDAAGGGGAPTTATYITQTPDAGLSAEQALSALATGLVKNTTGTGVLSIGAQGTDYYAPGGTDVAVADGGTGASTAAGARTALDVPSNAEAVLDTLFDANTVLAADSDDTPAALTMGASTILARLAAGNIKAATPAELRTLLDVPTTGEAILDAIVDAKGDIIVGTAADTVARLAIGADSLVATADSSQSSGISWQRPIGGVSALPAAALYETASRMMVTQNFAALATTRLTMVAIVLPKGVTITSITFLSGSTALSVGVNQLFGLYDDHLGTSTGTARALLRGSNNDGATAWGTNTLKTLNLTSSYLTTRSGTFYLGILVVATTVPNLLSTFAGATTLYQIEPKLAGTSNTAVTALPNPASALSTLASAPYAYVS